MPDECLVAKCEQVLAIDMDKRQVEVIASSDELIEGRGYRVIQKGIDWTFFKTNPVILWLHDDIGLTGSNGMSIAKAIPESIKVKKMGGNEVTVMTLEFPDAEMDEFGNKVWKMISNGYLNAVSIGFDIHKREVDEKNEIELLSEIEIFEVSVVTIPADKNAMIKRSKKLNRDPDEALALAQELEKLASNMETQAVPGNISTELAEEGASWNKPALNDFTSESWEDLSASEKRRIAKHFAWARTMPPEKFGDLKLPHHRASDGKVVWSALRNIAARINQTNIPSSDLGKVKSHVRSHYKAFGKDVPSSLQSMEDIEKQYQYFVQKQPVNKVAGKIMSKYLKARGEDVPEDETEAWELFGEKLEMELEEEKLNKQPGPSQETSVKQSVKPTEHRISLSALREAREDITQQCIDAAVEASRRGMTRKQIEGLVESLGKNLNDYYIKSFSNY